MLLCADEEAAAAALASGMLACPSCRSGRLRSWGWGRERAVRVPGGTRRLRPRRGRCRSCGATHVLLPAWTVPRRADSTGTIASAAALSALDGTGTARLGARLGVTAATVRAEGHAGLEGLASELGAFSVSEDGVHRGSACTTDRLKLVAVDLLGDDRRAVADQVGDLLDGDAIVAHDRDERVPEFPWGPALP